jgi:methenyltetrahydrofolate cyclohydrolase
MSCCPHSDSSCFVEKEILRVSAIATDDQIAAFLRVLDPADNSTGGGAASAIAGAMSAALAAMVARLSLGRTAAELDATFQEIAGAGSELAQALLAGSDEDARAFDAVMAAYRLPKGIESEAAARRTAIQAAIVNAARVPLQNAECCAGVLALVAQLERRSNPRAASDLRCADYLAQAGLQGCLANVEINLPDIKDPALAEEIRGRAQELRKMWGELAIRPTGGEHEKDLAV